MSDLSELACAACERPLERLRYFSRQLLTAEDMMVEQAYFRQKLRRHNRFLHGWGVVCGLSVEPAQDPTRPWQVRLCPGYAVAPQGDEILVDQAVLFDLATGAQQEEPCAPCPCPPQPQPSANAQRQVVWLAVRYSECRTRPVRVHPSGCGCDELACEYSRVRDDFNVAVLWELPAMYARTQASEDAWVVQLKAAQKAAAGRVAPLIPVPECPACPDDPWVIVATIRLPADLATTLVAADIAYVDRRVLPSESMLMQAVLQA